MFKSNGISFSKFILDIYERKVNKYCLNISKHQAMFEKITLKKESKVSIKTRIKILAFTVTAQSVLITYLKTKVTTSARRAAVTLNASHYTIMNKLKGKNTKLYKGRYLIAELLNRLNKVLWLRLYNKIYVLLISLVKMK